MDNDEIIMVMVASDSAEDGRGDEWFVIFALTTWMMAAMMVMMLVQALIVMAMVMTTPMVMTITMMVAM